MSTRALTTVDPYILKRVEHACALRAAAVYFEMRRGLPALATIASTAVLIGSFGTILGIFNSFLSYGSSRATILAATTDRLSQAMVPFLLGLAVSIFAFYVHHYLEERLHSFAREMDAETAFLTSRLLLVLRQSGTSSPLHLRGERLRPLIVAGELQPIALLPNCIYHNGILELIWPRIRIPVDADCALHLGMWILLSYAVFGALDYWNQRRPISALIVAAYFAVSSAALRLESRKALAGMFIFFALATTICIVFYGPTLTAVCLALAPLPLLGSVKALCLRRADEQRDAFRTLCLVSGWAALLLAVPALAAVSYGTVFRAEGVTDETMAPTLHEDDIVVSINLRFGGSIGNGQVVRVESLRGAGRVAGMPGDHIRISQGQLFRNGRLVAQPLGAGAPSEDFPLPEAAYSDEFARWQHRMAYGKSLDFVKEFVVPANTCFLLNDNLHDLADSRVFGPLPQHCVLGKSILAFRADGPFGLSVRVVR